MLCLQINCPSKITANLLFESMRKSLKNKDGSPTDINLQREFSNRIVLFAGDSTKEQFDDMALCLTNCVVTIE